MSAIKRAILYLSRKKARTVILLLILFVMGLMMLVGLSVRTGAENAIADVRKSLASSFTLSVKDDIPADDLFDFTVNDSGEDVLKTKKNLLLDSELQELRSVEGVAGVYVQDALLICYTGFDLTHGSFFRNYNDLLALPKEEQSKNQALIKAAKTSSHCNGFLAEPDTSVDPIFVNQAASLSQGRHIQGDDVAKAIISEQLAKENGLSLGDTFDAKSYDTATGELFGAEYPLEIVGIFQINFAQDLSVWVTESDILTNKIFVSPDIIDWYVSEQRQFYGGNPISSERDSVYQEATVYVEDPATMDQTIQAVMRTDLVDWDIYSIQYQDEDYQAAALPLQTISNAMTTLLIVVFAGGLITLMLLLLLWFKHRRFEIGVFVAVGTKKRNLFAQFLIETLLVCLISMVMAGCVFIPVTQLVRGALSHNINTDTQAEAYTVEIEEGTRELNVHRTQPASFPESILPKISDIVVAFALLSALVCISVLIAAQGMLKSKPRDLLFLR